MFSLCAVAPWLLKVLPAGDDGWHTNQSFKTDVWYAELAAMATKVLALVTSFDETTANQEAMAGAAEQFDNLLQAWPYPVLDTCYKVSIP